MSLDDNDFIVKNTGQNFENDSFLESFEKWCATYASIDGVGSMLAWVERVMC